MLFIPPPAFQIKDLGWEPVCNGIDIHPDICKIGYIYLSQWWYSTALAWFWQIGSKKCYCSAELVVKKQLPVRPDWFFFLLTINCSNDQLCQDPPRCLTALPRRLP
uniref:Uncharacterized protein n=1 Tax=Micrurus corallinus TaxID=54390 RepID=A0A2D4H1W9_MICCO